MLLKEHTKIHSFEIFLFKRAWNPIQGFGLVHVSQAAAEVQSESIYGLAGEASISALPQLMPRNS